MRALVEPFRHQHFGAGADESALAFDLDLDAHERLWCRVDHHGAKTERPEELYRSFKKRNLPHGDTWRHGVRPQSGVLQSSAPWVKKCLRMRCTKSVKTGSAIESS